MSETYYADSSALVKRHIAEAGSAWIEQEFDAANGNRNYHHKIKRRRSFKRIESPTARSEYHGDGIRQILRRFSLIRRNRLRNV